MYFINKTSRPKRSGCFTIYHKSFFLDSLNVTRFAAPMRLLVSKMISLNLSLAPTV